MKFIQKGITNILLIMAGVGLSLAICEAVLRCYNPFQFRVRLDKIVLLTNIKFKTQNNEIKKLDKIIYHSKNSLGFRGAPPPADCAAWLTIVAIGGSTTESFYVSDGKTWVDLLGKKLQGNFPQLWINNAGLDGHSTFGHLQLLKDYIIRLRPKYALFLVGLNDMGRDDLTIYDRSRNGLDIIRPKDHFFHRLANESEVLTLIINLSRYLKGYSRGLVHREISLADLEKLDRVDPARAANLLQTHRDKYLKPYAARLSQLIRMCREHGITPIFLTQPALYGPQVDEATKVNLGTIKIGKINGKLEWELLELYNEVTREVGAANGVPVIDLARQMPKNSNYYYDYFHFTDEGSQKVAQIIYEDLAPILALKEKSRLAPAPK
jgi:lysophospholipase L1-like esterase